MENTPLNQQYQEGRDWAYEVYQSARLRARVGFIVGIIGLAIGLISCLAVLGLTPLKTIQLQIVKVEQGKSVELLNEQQAANFKPDEWLTRADIANYIRDYETIDSADLDQRFERVRVRSDSAVWDNYFNGYEKTNAQSPLLTHGDKFKRKIQVNAISLLNPNTASVRFTSTDTKTHTTEHWVSIIGFAYQPNLKLSEQDRYLNPLGFLTTNYRRDVESIGQ